MVKRPKTKKEKETAARTIRGAMGHARASLVRELSIQTGYSERFVYRVLKGECL